MLESPTEATKEAVSTVVAAVGKLIVLPQDEEPTLVVVSDKTKLQSQAFFANAEKGDKVLIYPKVKKAYLYRPRINKLIDVAPANIGTAVAVKPVTIMTTPSPTIKPKVSPTITPTPTSALKQVNVVLYNGTKTSGLAASVQQKLKTESPNVTVVAKSNAVGSYTDTLVIDFTGKYNKEVTQLAKLLNGSIGVLPKNETKPTADILVILGPQ